MKYALILGMLAIFSLFVSADDNTTLNSINNQLTTVNTNLQNLTYNANSLQLISDETRFNARETNRKLDNVSNQVAAQNVAQTLTNSKLDVINGNVVKSNEKLESLEGKMINLTNTESNGAFMIRDELRQNSETANSAMINMSKRIDSVETSMANRLQSIESRVSDVVNALYVVIGLIVLIGGFYIGGKVSEMRSKKHAMPNITFSKPERMERKTFVPSMAELTKHFEKGGKNG